MLLLILLAGFCAVQLREPDASAPQAVVESQQALVESLAKSLAATAEQNASDLRAAVTVSDPASQPADLLAAVNQNQPKWRGLTLAERSTGKPIVTRGEAVAAATDASVTPVVGQDGQLRMQVSVPLPGDPARMLTAVTFAGIPAAPVDADLQHGLVLANKESQIVDSRGTLPKTDDAAAQSLLASAAARRPAPGRRAATSVNLATTGRWSLPMRQWARILDSCCSRLSVRPLPRPGLPGKDCDRHSRWSSSRWSGSD
ncbi:hypothetical protein [Kibdelosporangium aridum]|uniref:hypothetical protein n=1 Tax=Kibdelosporangium aridum TaxID=2030 RepID=UPI0035E82896